MGSLEWLCFGIYVFLSTYVNAGSYYCFIKKFMMWFFFSLLCPYQKINILSQKMCVQNCFSI